MIDIQAIAETAREGAIKFYIEGRTLYVQNAITGERAALGEEKRTFESGGKEDGR